LNGTKGHVKQRSDILVEAEAAQDEGSKGIGDGSSNVQEKGHTDPKVSFGLEEDFDSLIHLEFSGSNTSLIGS
jgi:hypothetical protein